MMASKTPPGPPGQSPAELFDFPCKFPVKAMGRNQTGFETLVREIVLAHAQMADPSAIKTTTSSAGKYLSVTIDIIARSKSQLDRIYQDLSACKQVLVAL